MEADTGVSLFDTLFKEFTGQRITPKERREAEAALDDLARQFAQQFGHMPEMVAPGVPRILRAHNGAGGEFVFEHFGFRVPAPGECYLHAGEIKNARTRAKRHVYRLLRNTTGPQPGPQASQEAPPRPARPSVFDQIMHAYSVLGVSREATPEQIRAAFARIARDNHPDRNPGDAAAERRMKEASAAYATLTRPHTAPER